MPLTDVRNRSHYATAERCLAREARERLARQRAEHRSLTTGWAGVRRPAFLGWVVMGGAP